ncbi:hypothetical protein [uncultured Ruminococcus sp.]|uniref:anti-sigma-I factor RsgI family protein n=1 Tax=uncultured Ruminococcus sp. TaxID=165186 RepID=UPI002638B131|nr:hypothetical protein [uncultured Ruminococcus sp.]
MKYIVMECNKGFAVLMDEESRFVKAADLRYEVGQTVTDPVLMEEESGRAGKITFHVGRAIAVAACLVLMVSAGSIYYSRNLKPHSTIVISSDANIRLDLNKKGKVLHIRCEDSLGREILKDYNGKGKDMLTVANEILELEKEKGVISDGDTVNFYIESDNSGDFNTYKSDVEHGIADINVNVRGLDRSAPEPPKNGEKSAAPAKPGAEKPDPAKNDTKPDAPKPPANGEKVPEPPAPPAAADPPAPPNGEVKPAEVNDPPAPPEPAVTPEPPKEEIKPGNNNAEPPKPDDGVEPPKPEDHPAAVPPKHDPKALLPVGEHFPDAALIADEAHIAVLAEEPAENITGKDETEPAPVPPPSPLPPRKHE